MWWLRNSFKSAARCLHSAAFKPTLTTRKAFKLSDIGEGINEVQIIKWHVQPSAKIEEFDVLVEVASDKATVDISAPFSGVLKSVSGKEGETIRVGETLCEITEEGEDGPQTSATSSETPQVDAQPSPSSATETPADAPTSAVDVHVNPANEENKSSSSPPPPASNIQASPATRLLARRHEIDLSRMTGTGKDGRIRKGDVLKIASGQVELNEKVPKPAASTSKAQDLPPVSSPKPSPLNEGASVKSIGKRVPLEPFREAMFKSMTASLQIPHFAYSEEIDVTEAERLRKKMSESIPSRYRKTLPKSNVNSAVDRIREEARFDRLTLLPILLKAMSQALFQHPIFTALLDTKASTPSLEYKSHHDISIALAADNGALFTPLIPAVDTLSIFDIASQVALYQSISPKFPPTAFQPGTITLSNVGVVGGTYTHPVIPPTGQLAIGAFGQIRPTLSYVQSQVAEAKAAALDPTLEVPFPRPRLMMTVTFTGDHRVVSGVELAKLVATWKQLVESPSLMLASMK